jgi:hypothetical protein
VIIFRYLPVSSNVPTGVEFRVALNSSVFCHGVIDAAGSTNSSRKKGEPPERNLALQHLNISQGLLILGSEESDPRNNTKEHETSDAEFVLFCVISWMAVLSLWQNDV